MSKQLKPVKMYGYPGAGGLIPTRDANDTAYLCLPLTPASRKAMIEAMADGIANMETQSGLSVTDLAEAALAALEAMAKP